jgi:hypothetical protein
MVCGAIGGGLLATAPGVAPLHAADVPQDYGAAATAAARMHG